MKQAMRVTAALFQLRTDCCLAGRAVSHHSKRRLARGLAVSSHNKRDKDVRQTRGTDWMHLFTSDRKAANFNVAVLRHGQPSLLLKQTNRGNATAVSCSTNLKATDKSMYCRLTQVTEQLSSARMQHRLGGSSAGPVARWHRALRRMALWHRALWHLALWHLALWLKALWHVALWHMALWHMALWHMTLRHRAYGVRHSGTGTLAQSALACGTRAHGALAHGSLGLWRMALWHMARWHSGAWHSGTWHSGT